MAMVDVDDSWQFSADSQPKSIGLVWELAATRRSVYIRQMNRVNFHNDFGRWSIIRAVLISKALVQQGSVETLYQNGNSLEQIAGFTVVARDRRDFLPKPC